MYRVQPQQGAGRHHDPGAGLPGEAARCMRGSRAPTEAGTKMRPASRAGKAMRSKRGAPEWLPTTMSASASVGDSSIRRVGPESPAMLARPLTGSRQLAAISRNPLTLDIEVFAPKGNPIAPRPAIATVLLMPPSSLRYVDRCSERASADDFNHIETGSAVRSANAGDIDRSSVMGGASNGTRTRDIQDHNLALYQLSYARHPGGACRPVRGARQDLGSIFRFCDGELAAPP